MNQYQVWCRNQNGTGVWGWRLCPQKNSGGQRGIWESQEEATEAARGFHEYHPSLEFCVLRVGQTPGVNTEILPLGGAK